MKKNPVNGALVAFSSFSVKRLPSLAKHSCCLRAQVRWRSYAINIFIRYHTTQPFYDGVGSWMHEFDLHIQIFS